MKKLLLLLLFIHLMSFGQSNQDVTLTVSGQGETMEEARANALRSAIEESFGAYVSSNTKILNDILVADEVVTVSGGNIKNFDVISEVQIPEGGYATTLRATVSVNKLKAFSASKGVNSEFKGGLFAANMIQQELNEKAELKAIENIIKVSKTILKKSFDYSINVEGNPKKEEWNNYTIPLLIKINLNKNFDTFTKYFNSSISGLNMNEGDIIAYKDAGKEIDLLLSYNKSSPHCVVHLRNPQSILLLEKFIKNIKNIILSFEVNNNLSKISKKNLEMSSYQLIDFFRIVQSGWYNHPGLTQGSYRSWAKSPTLISNSVHYSRKDYASFEKRNSRSYRNPGLFTDIMMSVTGKGNISTLYRTSNKRWRLNRSKLSVKVQQHNNNLILNFFNLYDQFDKRELKNYKDIVGSNSIIGIRFKDSMTLSEIQKITEYSVKRID